MLTQPMPEHIKSLIRLCKKGNQQAQMQLYDAYCQAMFAIACRYLKNENDAKDAMQEGFLKAFLNIESYQPKATFGAWLKRIIINQCLDALKKKQLDVAEREVETLQIIDDNDWNFSSNITKHQIVEAIEQLSEKDKIVVKLYLMEGYDHEEISSILKIPIKTSRTHLRRGKLKLRELLKNNYNATGY